MANPRPPDDLLRNIIDSAPEDWGFQDQAEKEAWLARQYDDIDVALAASLRAAAVRRPART
jgi:hypothetical protein